LWAEALPRRERARRLVDAALACGVGSIEVVGFGANGALVVEEALGRGARVRVRDERLDAGALRLPARAGLTAAGWGEGFVGGSAVVVSVGDDARVVSRLGGALAGVGRVLRWSSVSGEAVRDVGG
jgi:hypothetical protein